MAKARIKRGDTVRVIAGSEKGATGKVLAVDRKHERAVVEGLNVVKRHLRKNVNPNVPEGGILEKEAPIHLSNLKKVDA
ncbi:MAG: 50S ribosomal protein L24 [Deltaproteobacteria bacterium]|nr:MAG: 50S ribosomal protein L24 [Deltaproteobacteria bacterium]